MQRITPFLWFDGQAEEAAKFYVSVFKNSRITGMTHYGEDGPGPKGSVLTVVFLLDGEEFIALNGGPEFTFTPALSLVVNCRSQKEVDEYWEKLSEGGQQLDCGWLTDKYGVSWQVVPTALGELLMENDRGKADRVLKAMLSMKKIDIETLLHAFEEG